MRFRLKHLLLSIFSILSCTALFSQDHGEVCFIIRPTNAVIRIDNETLVDFTGLAQPYCMELEKGTHSIEIWSPIFKIYRDTIEITPGEKKNYIKAVQKPSDEYMAYHTELKVFHTKQIKRTLAISSAFLANTLLTVYVVGIENHLTEKRNLVLNAKASYDSAVGENDIKNAKVEYERQNSEYEKDRKTFYTKVGVGVPLTLASYFVTYKLIKKLKGSKPTAPEYHPVNPWSSMKLTIDAGWGYNGFKLTHNF